MTHDEHADLLRRLSSAATQRMPLRIVLANGVAVVADHVAAVGRVHVTFVDPAGRRVAVVLESVVRVERVDGRCFWPKHAVATEGAS